MKTLNMKNMICPYPVIQTKKTLKDMGNNDTLIVLVDNVIATENLEKMAIELGFHENFNVQKINDFEFKVTLVKGTGAIEEQKQVSKINTNSIIVISTSTMGNGDNALGQKLMEGFIYSLTEQEENILPKTIILYNEGVLLSTSNKKTIEDLTVLSKKGVEILSCGLCLDFYNVIDKLEVGSSTNMYAISQLFLTNNVININ